MAETTRGSGTRWQRRDLLRTGAAAAVAAVTGAPAARAQAAPAQPALIREENAKPGTMDWMLGYTQTDPGLRYRCSRIEGYCSKNSLRPGESLEIMVSANPASSFTIDVYRMGFYGGRGGRHMTRLGPFRGTPQPEPEVGPQRLRECRWEPATKLAVAADWPSGVYLGKLAAERDGVQSYVIFIVRDDRPCDFLFQCSDTTWAAYNRWPEFHSLYDDGVTTPPRMSWGPGVSVSFDRPYGRYSQIFDAPLSQGSGEFLLWEFPLAYWMEREGYDVSYASNLDTHADGATGLRRAKAFLSVGHDEYWTIEMYRNVREAIASGMHAAFLSGNSVHGLIPLLPSSSGAPARILTRYGRFQPYNQREDKYAADWKQHGPDPALLMGARSTFPANGGADWTCVNERHWLFGGTGMKNGDSISGLVGWEHHGEPADLPGLEVLARGPVFSRGRPQGTEYTATIYPGPKRNWVFNAATIWWTDGLAAPPGYLHPAAHWSTPPGPDPRVRRMTKNLFDRFRS